MMQPDDDFPADLPDYAARAMRRNVERRASPAVSAVPSGSAGEPTPTAVAAALAAHDAAILSALTGMSSTRVTVDEQGRRFQAVRDTRDALLSAVAAAATAQTADANAAQLDAVSDALRDYPGMSGAPVHFNNGEASAWESGYESCRNHIERALLRALAGGAPPATQTTDTTEE